MDGGELGRKDGGLGFDDSTGSAANGTGYRSGTANSNRGKKNKNKNKNNRNGGAAATRSVTGKIKPGNWSMILSAALGLDAKFDYMDKENAVNYSGGGTGTGTGN
jgi:hypothetical protein